MRGLGRSVERLLPLVLLAGLFLPASPRPAVAGDDPAAGEEAVQAESLGIRRILLDNGLRIFVLQRPSTPTFAALYEFGVGSLTDPKGRSGLAHVLEHMMFKGTRDIGVLDSAREARLLDRLDSLWTELYSELNRRDDPFRTPDEERIAALTAEIEKVGAECKTLVVNNEYDELMTRAGAVGLNASTGSDTTRYMVQLPANRLEFWFRLESARLTAPVFREFYSERDVVVEERRLRTENTAAGLAYETMLSLLFPAHPYGVPVIGWPRDLQRLTRQDALDYFTTYYSPANCVMVLVGDVETAEVRRLAEKYFGSWKRQQLPRLPVTEEPEQRGERRGVVEFDADPELSVAWRTVPEGHPDQYALDVLSMILGGLHSSRFDETIVQDGRIASRAGTSHPTFKHGGYLVAHGSLAGEHTAAELEAAFEREIGRVQRDGVSDAELERAKTAVEVSRVRMFKSNLGQAYRIAGAVLVSGGVDYVEGYERRIDAVAAEQVKQAAGQYLQPRRKIVVEVRKVEGAGGAATGGGADVQHRRGESAPRGTAHSPGFGREMEVIRSAKPTRLHVPEIGKDVQRVELEGGITVFVKEDHSAPTVEMSLAWLGGSNNAPVERLAPFELASSLLDEGGTESLSPAELQVRKDELGMSFSVWIGETLSGGRFWSLRRNFEESFELALEILMRPRLDAERLETLKGQYIDRMRRRDQRPGTAASVLLDHVIFKDHPRLGYVPSRREIEAITPEQIRSIWERHLGRDNLFLTVVGDFDAAAMIQRIERGLGAWRPAADRERRYITHDPILRPGAYIVAQDLPQPAIRIYHQIRVDRNAPQEDHAALEVLNGILGGNGFRSRLMERLRSDEGLTYGIYSAISHDERPGIPGWLRIAYQVNRDSVARSIDSVLEEVRKIIEKDVTAAEVQEQVEAWSNRFVFRYTNDFYIVSRLMYNELDDRPYDFDRLELEQVQKVTVEDVRRVGRQYLEPESFTVAVFGALSEEEKQRLADKLTLVELEKSVVFTGGYDELQQRPGPTPDGTR